MPRLDARAPLPARLVAAWALRPGRFFAVAALLTLLTLGLDVGVRALTARRPGPAGGAAWIWAERVHTSGEPVAFLAVGELRLPRVPRGVQLEIGVDEAYVVQINGIWIGAASYAAGEELHRYPVSDALRPGRNRIVVEARSVRGAGAILASLVDAEGRTLARSDAGWRIFRRAPAGLGNRTIGLAGGEAPRMWGHGSVGRWRLPEGRRLRPRLQAKRAWTLPQSGRIEVPVGDWQPLARGRRAFPFPGKRYVLYDFGQPVAGYLSLALDPAVGLPGLLAVGNDPPGRLSPPSEVIIPVPGATRWEDATVRRFRFCLVAMSGVVGPPRLRAVPPSAAAVLTVSQPVRGVFGLPAPPVQAPSIAFTIWQRLDDEQSLANERGLETEVSPAAPPPEEPVKKARSARKARRARAGRP